MRIVKILGSKVLAVALAFSVLPAAVPSNVPLVGVTAAKAEPYGYRRHGGFHRNGYYGGRRGYYGHDRYYRRHHHNNYGGAAIAGIVGLGLGAAIASSAQPRYVERRYIDGPDYYAGGYRSARFEPWSRGWYNYCSSRYRSFDPRSGTFQPYNGPRQFCQ